MNFQNELELLRCAIRYKNPKLGSIACSLVRQTLGLGANDTLHPLSVACTFVECSATQENMRTLSAFLSQHTECDASANVDEDANEVPQVPSPDEANNVHSCDSEGSIDMYSIPAQQ